MNYDGVEVFLDGKILFEVFNMVFGMLVFFCGCNLIYCVFLNESDKMCMLVVFVYNFEFGIEFFESVCMMFYGCLS